MNATDAESSLDQQILVTLQGRQPSAAFVSEVTALIRPSPGGSAMEEALASLDQAGKVLVADHAAPDVHLASVDLRVIAYVEQAGAEYRAIEAAETVWSSWLKSFLATHRCE